MDIEQRTGLPDDPSGRNSENSTRRGHLQEIRNKLETVRDAMGQPIDEGIKETVVFLNALNISTVQSCEGHADEKDGRPMPWVSMGVEGEPEERFVGQLKAFEDAAIKYGISLDRLKKADPNEIYWEVMEQVLENEETDEFKSWTEKNKLLMRRVEILLDEFYQNRNVEPDIKLEIESGVGGEFEIHSHEEQMKQIFSGKLSIEDWTHLSEKLPSRQEEMRLFTDFLKGKYRGAPAEEVGESQIDTKEEDEKEISEIRKSLGLE